jgi:hypothetical protein
MSAEVWGAMAKFIPAISENLHLLTDHPCVYRRVYN